MKFKVSLLFAFTMVQACSWNHSAGLNDRFQIITTTELFAPSTTIIHDTKTDVVTPIGGQSVFGQLSGPASAAIGGYLIGEGLSESGDTVNANNNNPSSSHSASNQTATSSSVSSSTSNALSSSSSKSFSNSNLNNRNININNNANNNANLGGKPGKPRHY